MCRTKLADRKLPDYTKGEEIFNMVSHIVGGAFGIAALTLCVIKAALASDAYGVVSCSVYGASMVVLYTMSSVYHGLRKGTSKKVMQVIDHCTIYFLIGGTYTPIALCAVRKYSTALGWVLFGLVWGFLITACVFTAIDLKKFSVLSMICYILTGWCVVFFAKPVIKTVPVTGLIFLLLGGISYTVGAVLYGLGSKHRYMHSVFHIFVVLGSLLQFFCIFFYVL